MLNRINVMRKEDRINYGCKLNDFTFAAESLGLPYLNAYLDAVGSNFSHGANFATAGSTIRPQNTTLHQSGFSPFSFNVQWYQFHDFHHRSQIFRSKGTYVP